MSSEPDNFEGSLPLLEKYRVVKKLAAGGMASIFIAAQRGSGEICVVKTLHDHLAQDSVVGNRFLREARVASELRHPNIARLMDAKSENGIFYLAMEFIAGHDLESIMFKLMEQRKMLPPELSVRVTLDVLEGLHHAHEYTDADGNHLEIVHRDLSPRNVMITYEGDVKIIDFGLARTNLGEFRTAPGMVLGTLRYMSPEQAVAEPVDRRSDLYSWTVVLYEMLSGRPLVIGNNAQEILHAVVTQVPPPLSTLNAHLPKGLDAVLAKGMEKEREDRWSSAAELAQAIRDAAPDLCKTKQHKIGRFVASVFPDARENADDLTHPTGDIPEYEPTRAGQALTAAFVPSPAVSRMPASTSIEQSAEHFVPTNIYVAPTSLHSMSAPQVSRPKRTMLWATALLAAAALVITAVAVVLPEPQSVPVPAVAPQGPSDPVVTQTPEVMAKSDPTPEPRRPPPAPPPPSPKSKPAPRKVRAPAEAPAPPPPRQAEKPTWEAKVKALLNQGRNDEAAKLIENRARELGATRVKDCVYDAQVFGNQLDGCVSQLKAAEQKAKQ